MFNVTQLFSKRSPKTNSPPDESYNRQPIETKATKANKLFMENAEITTSTQGFINAYSNADLIYSCVSYASDIISQIKINAFKQDKQGELTEYGNEKLLNWLRQPNPFQSMPDILYLYAQSYFLAGNAYLTFEKVGSNYEGWILNPVKTKVVPDTRQFIKGYIYDDKVAYKLNEMIPFKNSFLGNEFYGQSYLTALVDPLSIEGFAVDDLKSFFANSLVAQGIFTSEFPLTKAQIEALREQFRTLYGRGGEERYGHIIAPNSLKYQPLKLTPKDGMLLEALGVTEERIYKVFRLNPILLGIGVKNTSNSGTSLKEQKKIYINNFIRPIINRMLKQWETAFRRIFKDPDLVLMPDYSAIPEVNTALEEKIDSVKTAVSLGLLSQNEGRAVLGYRKLEGQLMDSHLAPSYLYGTEPLDLMTGEVVNLAPTNQQPSPNGSTNSEGGKQDGVSR